MEIV
ncbi:hypothetical protein CFP56_004797 [Quercus suber]|jgi:short-subunit dehydrogenase